MTASHREVTALGHRLHLVEAGEGEPAVVLLHGIPASSRLWREVVPRLAPAARVLAPDLRGLGASEKPADVRYDLPTQAAHLEALLQARGVTRYVLVAMDLGLLVGLHHASLHPERVAGVVLFEGLFLPPAVTLRALGPGPRLLRSVLGVDWLAERLLASGRGARAFLRAGVARTLSREELDAYVEPLLAPGHLRRLWLEGVGPRQLWALASRPGDTVDLMDRSAAWLAASSIPCLLLAASPGMAVTPRVVAEARRRLPRLEVRAVGRGRHFLPEDQPEAVARAVLDLLEATRHLPPASGPRPA